MWLNRHDHCSYGLHSLVVDMGYKEVIAQKNTKDRNAPSNTGSRAIERDLGQALGEFGSNNVFNFFPWSNLIENSSHIMDK